MAGERSLIETLRDEVDQLLQAHCTMDAMRQEYLVKLERACVELEPDRSSMFDVLEHGHTMLSEEADDQHELETLVSQIQAESKGVSSSSQASLSAPSKPLTAADVRAKVDEARRRRDKREAKAADIGLYEKMLHVMDANARSSINLSPKAKTLIAQCEKTRSEHQALAEENKLLQDAAEASLKDKEAVSKNVLELFRKVKSIETTFKERSRFGAWLCDEHSDETEDLNPSPLNEQMAKARQVLHNLKLQQKDLLLACQHIGLDLSPDDEESSKRATSSTMS